MRRLWTVGVLVAAMAGAVGASQAPRIWVGPANWFDYQPDAPLVARQFYREPYSRVVYVADKVTLVDGSEVFILENIRGTYCRGSRTCSWPVTQGRGVWFPVEVTIEPVP